LSFAFVLWLPLSSANVERLPTNKVNPYLRSTLQADAFIFRAMTSRKRDLYLKRKKYKNHVFLAAFRRFFPGFTSALQIHSQCARLISTGARRSSPDIKSNKPPTRKTNMSR